EAKGGPESGVISAAQKWVAPDSSVPLTSVQTLRVHQRAASERMFDFTVTLTAGEKDVILGDTKEGTFAMRIAESMRLKTPKGAPAGTGRILNSEGVRDAKVWGQAAKWVDMYGPIGGKTYGIAIFDHPKNLRHPTRWHARDYGLFAANPFCGKEMDPSLPAGSADYTLKASQSLTLQYRVFIHEGDANATALEERFREFAAQSK
ncbi:MAG TPA: PmoA family protein, partial [Chthoniobacteraceae bacterium]|nr:PmoA family protein [Chthoniobacteraceae bacterium]